MIQKMDYLWLYLCDNCDNIIITMPVSSINRRMNGNKMRFFRNVKIDISKSYLMAVGGALTSANGLMFIAWTK